MVGGCHLAGRNPPRKSDTSVCWLQFRMCSRWPRMSAAIWQTVVLPVPVSPTRSTGSAFSRHLHTAQKHILLTGSMHKHGRGGTHEAVSAQPHMDNNRSPSLRISYHMREARGAKLLQEGIPVNQGVHAAHACGPHDAGQGGLQRKGVRIGALRL